MALVPPARPMLIPAILDPLGNAIIPNVAPYPAALDPRSAFEPTRDAGIRRHDIIGGWADVSGDRADYVGGGPFRIRQMKHRFLQKTVGAREDARLYEVYIDTRVMRTISPIVEEAQPLRRDLKDIATRTVGHTRRLYNGAILLPAAREKFLQKYFPILGVRKEPMPPGVTNISSFSIIPASSRVVREGFALATFHNHMEVMDLDEDQEAENRVNRVKHRKASQAIWTSLVLPFLMLIAPSARQNLNDVHIKITMTFVVESISDATPLALFYLTIPIRYYHISDSNQWLRDLQYSFLNRLTYTDISRTDSDRRVRSIEQINITFVKNNLNAGPANLGGFIPTPITAPGSQGDTVTRSVIDKVIGGGTPPMKRKFQKPDAKPRTEKEKKDGACHDMFAKNTFKWCDTNGWFLASFKSEAKEMLHESTPRRMCLYWACLKGIRLIEHSFYDINPRWKSCNNMNSQNLQNDVHRHLVKVMKLPPQDDTEGISYGSPLIQALANVLEVDIRINDSNWNILSHYVPTFERGRTYPKKTADATCTSRQIFSLDPICEKPTIVLVLLEHLPETLSPGMGMTFDIATDQWENNFSAKNVVSAETTTLRIPGDQVMPAFNRDSSLWHYWLVVSVDEKSEYFMMNNYTLALKSIPMCSHCEKLKCRMSLLTCNVHGPSPSNSGDRRRRIFMKSQKYITCEECGIKYCDSAFHVCCRRCPTCEEMIPYEELGDGRHACQPKKLRRTNSCSSLSSMLSTTSSTGSKKWQNKPVDERKDRCDMCGVIILKTTMDKHVCNPDCIQYYQRFKNKVPSTWNLGKGKIQPCTFDGYIIWDLETFPCAEDGYRMHVYRCGLYHNTFARDQMGLDGTYVDFVCTTPTASGRGDVILRFVKYLAKPEFNNFIAMSYFGCIFDHYLLLQNILSDKECFDLFRVSQPDFVDSKKRKEERSESFISTEMEENPDFKDKTKRGIKNTKKYREHMKEQNEDRMKQPWIVKSKKIFSMWLSEPTEQDGHSIAPRYSIKFIDLGLFTQCSLKQACKDFGLSKDESKQIFPHDFIASWKDLSYVGPVPDKKFFPLSSRDEATIMKYEYERNKKQWNLLDISEEYLKADVLSTRAVFLRFSHSVSEKLGIPLTSSVTLPSLAQKVLKKSLKEVSKVIVDLPKTPTESTDFRKTIFGGRVMPLRDKFISPALEDLEADLVILRRCYASILSDFVSKVSSILYDNEDISSAPGSQGDTVSRSDITEVVGGRGEQALLRNAYNEILSASKVCPPENVFVLLAYDHMLKLPTVKPIFDELCKSKLSFCDWNDWVAIRFERVKTQGCLRAVDVSSLYPSSMAFHPYPVGGHDEIDGFQLELMNQIARKFNTELDFSSDIAYSPSIMDKRIEDLRSMDGWPQVGMYYVKYIPNQKLSIPILPRKEKKLLLWDLISSEGWYNSVDIENAIVFGYHVEFIRGYQWMDTSFIFKDAILNLFNIKQMAEENGDLTLRSIAKLLMNSMYGKLLQRPIDASSYLVYNDYDLATFMKHFLWTGFESVGVDNLCLLAHGIKKPLTENTNGVVQWDVNEAPTLEDGKKSEWVDGQPIHLGSLILGYSRRIMLKYFCASNPSMDIASTAYYTDTDSIFLSNDQFESLQQQGFVKDGLGFLADDFKGAIGVEAYFNNPKSYLVTKMKKAKGSEPAQLYSQIKAKGIAKSCLSNTYKLGFMDEGDNWLTLPARELTSLRFIMDNEDDNEMSQRSLLTKHSVKNGDSFEGSDPEILALMTELLDIDEDLGLHDDPDVAYSWLNNADYEHEDDNNNDTGFGSSPLDRRDERLMVSSSHGKLDRHSFMNARKQCDGKSVVGAITEHLTFPTFKKYLGLNNQEVGRGEQNFSIVPKQISRSFGSRLYLGAKLVKPGGFYRPWNNADIELNAVGNAALARAGPKGEKWAQQYDMDLDEDMQQV